MSSLKSKHVFYLCRSSHLVKSLQNRFMKVRKIRLTNIKSCYIKKKNYFCCWIFLVSFKEQELNKTFWRISKVFFFLIKRIKIWFKNKQWSIFTILDDGDSESSQVLYDNIFYRAGIYIVIGWAVNGHWEKMKINIKEKGKRVENASKTE